MSVLLPEEKDALAVLAKRNRLLVILVPVGVEEKDVKQISRDINERLDALVEKRGPLT